MALTDTQRAENRAHARRRVKVEHAISGAKRLGCVTRVYRNKYPGLQRPGDGLGLWYPELASDQKEKGYLGTVNPATGACNLVSDERRL